MYSYNRAVKKTSDSVVINGKIKSSQLISHAVNAKSSKTLTNNGNAVINNHNQWEDRHTSNADVGLYKCRRCNHSYGQSSTNRSIGRSDQSDLITGTYGDPIVTQRSSTSKFCIKCGFALVPQGNNNIDTCNNIALEASKNVSNNHRRLGSSSSLRELTSKDLLEKLEYENLDRKDHGFGTGLAKLNNGVTKPDTIHVQDTCQDIETLSLNSEVKRGIKDRFDPTPIINMRSASQHVEFMASFLEVENAKTIEECYQSIANDGIPLLLTGAHNLESSTSESFRQKDFVRVSAPSSTLTNERRKSRNDASRHSQINEPRDGLRTQSIDSFKTQFRSSVVLDTNQPSSASNRNRGRRRHHEESRHKPLSQSKSHGYLDHVEPVSVFYQQMIQRDKDLAGLTVSIVPVNNKRDQKDKEDQDQVNNGNCKRSDEMDIVDVTKPAMWFWGAEKQRQERMKRQIMQDELDSAGADGSESQQSGMIMDDNESDVLSVASSHPMFWTDLMVHSNLEELDNLDAESKEDDTETSDNINSNSKSNNSNNNSNINSNNVVDKTSTASGIKKMASAVISRIYRSSCIDLKQAIVFAEINFRHDPITWPTPLSTLRVKFDAASKSIDNADVSESRAKSEYEEFKAESCRLRGAVGTAIAMALQDVSDIHAKYKRMFDEAAAHFEDKQAKRHFALQLNYVKNSDEHMDAIQIAADEELKKYNQILKDLQRDEIVMIEELRSLEFAVIETIKSWRPRHMKLIHSCRVSQCRVELIWKATAARFIQRTARRRLLMYFRESKKRKAMRRIKYGIESPPNSRIGSPLIVAIAGGF